MSELVINIISCSVMGIIASFVVMLLQTFFSKRLSAKTMLYIWIPVIMRFLIPYIPESKASIYNYLPGADSLHTPVIPQITTDSAPEFAIHLNILPIIWLCGVVITLSVQLIAYYKFMKSIKYTSGYSEIAQSTVKRACEMCNIKKEVRIFTVKNNISPLIAGFIKPRIFIPEKILGEFQEQQIVIVLTHELTHYKQKDRLWNVLTVFINTVHWFNPLVRIVTGRIQRDVENACDEKAMEFLGADEKYAYSKTLIDLAALFPGGILAPSVSPMAGSSNSLKARIKKIYASGRKKLNAIALPMTVIISVTMLTGAADTKATAKIKSVVQNLEPVFSMQNILDKKAETLPDRITSELPEVTDVKEASVNNAVTPNITNHSDTQIQNSNTIAPDQNFNRTANKTDILQQEPDIAAPEPNSTSAENHAQANTTTSASNYDSNSGTYTYSGKNTTLVLSNNPTKSGFAYESEDLTIETVGISSSSDEKISGNFNIYRNGELVQSNVQATISASPSTITFNDSQSSDYDFSFDVQTKTVD